MQEKYVSLDPTFATRNQVFSDRRRVFEQRL